MGSQDVLTLSRMDRDLVDESREKKRCEANEDHGCTRWGCALMWRIFTHQP